MLGAHSSSSKIGVGVFSQGYAFTQMDRLDFYCLERTTNEQRYFPCHNKIVSLVIHQVLKTWIAFRFSTTFRDGCGSFHPCPNALLALGIAVIRQARSTLTLDKPSILRQREGQEHFTLLLHRATKCKISHIDLLTNDGPFFVLIWSRVRGKITFVYLLPSLEICGVGDRLSPHESYYWGSNRRRAAQGHRSA